MQIKAMSAAAAVGNAATAYSPIIDMGTGFDLFLKQAHLEALKAGDVAAGAQVLTIEVSDNADMSSPSTAPAPGLGGDARAAVNSTAANSMYAAARMTKRYARAKFVNGTTPQGATCVISLAVKVREL
jgi:hypothetical protein